MSCEQCHEREAVIQLTQIVNEQVTTLHLCERCAAEKGVESPGAQPKTPLGSFLAAMGQELPTIKRILELNPAHPLVVGLRDAHGERPDDGELAGTARLLHDMALLAEGGDLTDPARFVALLAQRLERAL